MNDPLPIVPLTAPLDATVRLPGSKSITNRALILAALAEGQTRLENALFSRDTRIMRQALETLGFSCRADEAAHTLMMTGRGGRIPVQKAEINVGNAGTAARFLTAFLALEKGGVYRLDGDPVMRRRPMSGLLNALSALGAADFEYHGEAGRFPFTLKAKGYGGGKVTVDATTSSQILSALLLAAPAGTGAVEWTAPGVRPAYVSLTLKVREAFGAPTVPTFDETGNCKLEPILYKSPAEGCYRIEPDVSAASYFMALTLIAEGRLKISGLGIASLQGDARFADVLSGHGLQINKATDAWTVSVVRKKTTEGGLREIDFNSFSDTFLTYAALTPLLGGQVRIAGIGHTRHQETDRIAGMATELSKLGQSVKEEADALVVTSDQSALRKRALQHRKRGELIEIDTYEDHRFAMSFAILGNFDLLEDGQPWLAIKDPSCCEKTFPRFFETLECLRND